MNKLTMIQQAVAAHFAAKDARSRAYINDPDSLEAYRAEYDYNPAQDAAMLMLQSLLPLLSAAVAWESMPKDVGFDESLTRCDNLGIEALKLLSEVDTEPAPEAVVWPPSALVCHCEEFEGEGWNCERCGGGKF